MNNIKTTLVVVLAIALTAFVLSAIWSGIQPSNAGYNTKTAGVISTESSSEQSVEVVDESAVMDVAQADMTEASATTDNQTAITDSVETDVAATDTATQQAMQQAATNVTDVKQAITEEVVAVTEGVTESVEAVVNNNNKENEVEGALYSVVEGNKLDANSYEGFKLYRNWCARCHGTYGQGMVGPNLADSLKIISEKQFFDTVENGKTGTIGSMPSWKANVQVMEGRDQLYAYLKARSDGAIGEVKPKKQ